MSTIAAQQDKHENVEYGILDQIIAETRMSPGDEAYAIASVALPLSSRSY